MFYTRWLILLLWLFEINIVYIYIYQNILAFPSQAKNKIRPCLLSVTRRFFLSVQQRVRTNELV